jgi:N-acetylglucosaminyldiphosphoundecaprenol N-acetyl-beta-D-mannosaminyltransferase
MDQAVERCLDAIAQRRYLQHMSVNTAKIVGLQDDPAMRKLVNDCGLITADGQGVVWATRLIGDAVPERVAGIDLMWRLLAEAARHGLSVFVLGARKDVLATAITRLQKAYPALSVAGYRDGYFTDDEIPAICGEIRASGADLVFVAMSSPRKEQFLGQHGHALGAPFVMGVGGSIDVVAGLTRRAPPALQRLGLEWLYRLMQEPGRLWRRYLFTNTRFALLVTRGLLTRVTAGDR